MFEAAKRYDRKALIDKNTEPRKNKEAQYQCWDYCHFHESECESLSYESESESFLSYESESESTKTQDHESEFEKFENLTGK